MRRGFKFGARQMEAKVFKKARVQSDSENESTGSIGVLHALYSTTVVVLVLLLSTLYYRY